MLAQLYLFLTFFSFLLFLPCYWVGNVSAVRLQSNGLCSNSSSLSSFTMAWRKEKKNINGTQFLPNCFTFCNHEFKWIYIILILFHFYKKYYERPLYYIFKLIFNKRGEKTLSWLFIASNNFTLNSVASATKIHFWHFTQSPPTCCLIPSCAASGRCRQLEEHQVTSVSDFINLNFQVRLSNSSSPPTPLHLLRQKDRLQMYSSLWYSCHFPHKT